MADVRRKQRILGLIQSQGQASLDGLMLELKLTREQLTSDIAELVQQGLIENQHRHAERDRHQCLAIHAQGTGSYPLEPSGWQRSSRRAAK